MPLLATSNGVGMNLRLVGYNLSISVTCGYSQPCGNKTEVKPMIQ